MAALPQCARLIVQPLWQMARIVELPSAVTALLAELSVLAYQTPAQITACLKASEFRDWELFPEPKFAARQDRIGAARPPRAVVLADEKRIYLAFRGTQFASDWGCNLRCTFYGTPRRHAGFQGAWSEMADVIRAWLAPRLKGGRTLHLAGHSLGGALATIAALELAAAGLPVSSVVTLGSPKVGGSGFGESYRRQPVASANATTLGAVTLRYQHGIDLVATAMPPFFYKHVVPATLLPAQTLSESPGLIQRDASPAAANLIKHTVLAPDGTSEVIGGAVTSTHTENLGYILSLALALVLNRVGWPAAIPFSPQLIGAGRRGYTGAQHHCGKIYASILSPGKILGQDWLNQPVKNEQGILPLLLAVALLLTAAYGFGGSKVALLVLACTAALLATGIAVAVILEISRERKARSEDREFLQKLRRR